MKRVFFLLCVLLLGITALKAAADLEARAYADQDPAGSGDLLILCYHSILPEGRAGNPYTLTRRRFVLQMEYLRANDYQPVSLDTVLAASRGEAELPEKAVMLTFDDARRSYYDFVMPVLDQYGYPSMQAVVGSWIENKPPSDLPEPLMTWDQIRKADDNPMVTIVSHTFNLHRYIGHTAQGDTAPAATVRAYREEPGRYETEFEYRRRLQRDFKKQEDLFLKQLGAAPKAVVWPYGFYTTFIVDAAAENGIELGFALDEKRRGLADLSRTGGLVRLMIQNEPISSFIDDLENPQGRQPPMRAAQVDLDLIYEPGEMEKTEHNLGLLVDRLEAMGVNTVFLQAFADPEGTGRISEVYFDNSELPVRADIFGHAVDQIRDRGIRVYAWMPCLALEFSDQNFNRRFEVRQYRNGRVTASTSWYKRLTPFSREVVRKTAAIYEDLAAGSMIDGVLFQDDAYLAESEDFHPLAVEAFGRHMDRSVSAGDIINDDELSGKWTHFKTQRLITYLEQLAEAVRKYRPDARFARNMYARLLTQPGSEQWFAQNYEKFMESYDYVSVMAYSQMEEAQDRIGWLKELAKAASHPKMRQKTVFKLQAYDWEDEKWVSDKELLKEMRAVLGQGVRHIAYYPDNLWRDKPGLSPVKLEMSTRIRAEGK
ncbi:MAG: poly-beta-1,6-N-acetyl-D-glucosamine N-deacetylase PgaB [Desulfobacteraceae bacterium]|nr:poly-beta-1,6-N-acetyl-D-glucosamine N-deacetylase PgaB [Desulfobacteraceae bacterium]